MEAVIGILVVILAVVLFLGGLIWFHDAEARWADECERVVRDSHKNWEESP